MYDTVRTSVVVRHRIDADPEPTLHFVDDQDPDPYPKFHTCWNIREKNLLYLQKFQSTLSYLSRQSYQCHNFLIFWTVSDY